jgi:hypothetical protein
MRYFLVVVGLYLVTHFIPDANAEPRARALDLHKRTTLIAYIVPDLGTRFTFPFILDEGDSYVPFTLTLTNPAFKNERVQGRNYFVITAPVSAQGGGSSTNYGNIFVTVAGFEITIELRTTNDLSKHYSDVVFQLTADDREDLIQKGVAQRTKTLETEYKKKFEAIETTSDQKAVARVGKLALTTPSHKRIKEEGHFKLTNGDKVTLFVDEAVNYEPYSIFVFNIINDSNTQGLAILDAKIFAINPETKESRPLDVGKDVPPRVLPNESIQGAITVLDTNLNPKDLLKLQILTDKGTVEAQW